MYIVSTNCSKVDYMLKIDLNNCEEYRKFGGIYGIKCVISDTWYIGSSLFQIKKKYKRNLITRIKDHIRDLKTNKHCNKHLQSAWNKYSSESFEFYLLEKIHGINELNENLNDRNMKLIFREQYYLDLFKDQYKVYNQQDAARNTVGWNHSEENKLKISERNKKRIYTKEQKEELRQWGIKYGSLKRTPESIEKSASARRYTYKYVSDIFEQNLCELISKEYLGVNGSLIFKCHCGNIQETTFVSFRLSPRCDGCRKKNRSISSKIRKNKFNITYQDVTKSLHEWADDRNIKYITLLRRFKLGWTAGQCLGFEERLKKKRIYKNTQKIKVKTISKRDVVFDSNFNQLGDNYPEYKSKLYIWLATCRRSYKENKLSEYKVKKLESVVWWKWEGLIYSSRHENAKSKFYKLCENNSWKIMEYTYMHHLCKMQCPEGHIIELIPKNLKKALNNPKDSITGCNICRFKK